MSMIHTIQSWLTSPMERIFANSMPHADYAAVSALRNEPVSFCLAFRAMYQKSPTERIPDLPISVVAECEGVKIASYAIGNVPLDATLCEDGKVAAGAVPDVLLPRITVPEIRVGDQRLPFYEVGQKYLLNASVVSTGGVWFTFNEAGQMLEAGDHSVSVRVISLTTGETIREHSFHVHVINAALPKDDFIYTNWFHYDCLADYYGVDLYSDAYFDILESYIKNAVKHGQNTLLTPAFTPALDTAVGMERKNVQLVGVKLANGKYTFDFSLLDRWIEMCDRIGVQYFEIAHFFTQWGAEHAPKIMATVDGEYKRIFGWDTDATGDEYTTFLQSFLTEFLAHMKKNGNDKRCFFHVSDEPREKHLESYRAARAVVSELLKDYTIMDALSNYVFWKDGVVSTPIPSNKHIAPFIEGRVPNLWTYYCCSETQKVSNRLIAMPSWRNRSIGFQMYKYDIVGFLQWGYNFYYNRQSGDLINPYLQQDGDAWVPAGDAFSVYPAPNGEALESLRIAVFYDALQDMRAMRLCEQYCGKDAVVAVIDEEIGTDVTFDTCAKNAAQILKIRERVNEMLRQAVKTNTK